MSNSFCRGIQLKAFLKLTKHEKSKFQCLCGLDFTYLSISVFCEDAINCAMHFSETTLFSFQNSFLNNVGIQSIVED